MSLFKGTCTTLSESSIALDSPQNKLSPTLSTITPKTKAPPNEIEYTKLQKKQQRDEVQNYKHQQKTITTKPMPESASLAILLGY